MVSTKFTFEWRCPSVQKVGFSALRCAQSLHCLPGAVHWGHVIRHSLWAEWGQCFRVRTLGPHRAACLCACDFAWTVGSGVQPTGKALLCLVPRALFPRQPFLWPDGHTDNIRLLFLAMSERGPVAQRVRLYVTV